MATRHRGLFIRLSQFRLFLRKLVLTLVVICAFGLVFLNKADNAGFNKNQDILSHFLYPIVRVIQLPADGVYLTYQKIKDIVFVYKENNILKQKTQKFDELRNRFYALEIENALLAEMLFYTPPQGLSFVTAKIIAGEGDGFSHSLIAYVPETKGIQKGQVVLFKDAVIGRVDRVRGAYARIMLISDISSKIPVFIERTRDKGILSGNNTQILNLLFTASNADIQKGDRIVTSGIGGIFPSNLLVGYVSKATQSSIEVIPAHNIEKVEYVKIIRNVMNEDIFAEDANK